MLRLAVEFQSIDRLLRQSPRRRAEDPQQTLVVARVDQQFEVGDRILDFAPLEKLLPADQPVGNPLASQGLFELARQMVRSVQNREVAKTELRLLLFELQDHIADELRLRFAVLQGDHPHRLSFAEVAPEPLLVSLLIQPDHGVGGVENPRGRAVVLFELHHLRPGKLLGEAEDVADVSAAPGVDALVVVADHAEVATLAGELFDDGELGRVGVLVFVDQEVAIGVAVAFEHIRVFGEEPMDQHEHVVEIEGILHFEQQLVLLVDLGGDRFEGGVGAPPGFFRRDQPVLPAADHRLNGRKRELPLRTAESSGRLLEQSLLIGIVCNGERGQIAELRNLAPENADAEGVEGAERHPAGDGGVDQRREPFAHLARRLVGEGHAEDLLRRNSGAEHVGDAVGDDAGLAGSGAGEHQHRPFDGAGGGGLFRIETGENRIN